MQVNLSACQKIVVSVMACHWPNEEHTVILLKVKIKTLLWSRFTILIQTLAAFCTPKGPSVVITVHLKMSARRAELSNALLLQLLTIPLSYKRLFKEMCHKVWTRGLRLHPPVLIYHCNEHAVMHDYQAIIFGYHANRVHHGTSLQTEKNSITERELCFPNGSHYCNTDPFVSDFHEY